MKIFQQNHHIRQTKISSTSALVIAPATSAQKPERRMSRRFKAVSY
jgi:hypothetical protein